jgi:hypothetical protein
VNALKCIIIFAALMFIGVGFHSTVVADDFYIASTGDDRSGGSKEKPLATLEAARDATRKAGAGPHRILVMPGDYFMAQTLELDAHDNGLTIEGAGAGKVTIYGGKLVTGWRRDGEKFWCADIPGDWDFRALVVNERMSKRARLPETGTFIHQSKFDVRWMPSFTGGWERKPTQEELTTMRYDAKDIPASLEPKNAEVSVYHSWDESLCGVARNDSERHVLMFSTPAAHPPGAFGVSKYVVFNTREGMTTPGQWYLDRVAGRLVYWPLPGEDMAQAKVVAPMLEKIVQITRATNITLRGLSLEATTTPLTAGGFCAAAFEGALRVDRAQKCVFEKLEVRNVGGQGIVMATVDNCRIADNHIHHTGACGIVVEGEATLVTRNHIHHVGVCYLGAPALLATTSDWADGKKGFHICRNEIHDTPYIGVVGRGGNHVIEENFICRVMREMQDGAAIYGSMSRSILRGNVARDIVKMGEGTGVAAYYLDEDSQDSIVERNVSIGVERPILTYTARNHIIRDNVFIAETNMVLHFVRSSGCVFQGNTLFAPGAVTVRQPNAVTLWTNNVVFHGGLNKTGTPRPFTIADALPSTPPAARRTYPVAVPRVGQPPQLDGEIGGTEWPTASVSLDREPSRADASGKSAFAKLAYDDHCLYVAVNVALFDVTKLTTGTKWGKDDGVEVCIAGQTPEGKPVVFVIHGFAGGAHESVTLAGAPADAAERLGKAVRFAVKTGIVKGNKAALFSGSWRSEWAIPWDALGLKPIAGRKIAFNLGVRRTEDNVWRCYEGTLRQNWRLDQAGTMQLK